MEFKNAVQRSVEWVRIFNFNNVNVQAWDKGKREEYDNIDGQS